MKRAFFSLILMLSIYLTLGLLSIYNILILPNDTLTLLLYCGICGGIGGVTYCLRGIYLNACVYNRWSESWLPWYFIRPIVSFICGSVSCLFLKAGLIILEASQSSSSSNFAFYALSFVAGLNVDKFIERVESIAQTTWGIKLSRTSTREDEKSV